MRWKPFERGQGRQVWIEIRRCEITLMVIEIAAGTATAQGAKKKVGGMSNLDATQRNAAIEERGLRLDL
jgi:hypothetical protein